jgi:hypothetical protein
MRKLFSFSLIFLTFATSYGQQPVLPDQNFTVKVLQKNPGEKPVNLPEEEITIVGNGISSSFSKKEGFLSAAIGLQNEEQSTAGATTFTAACTNARNCALKWSCTIKDNKIEGKAEKFFTGKLAGEYIFSGTLKK